MSNKSANKILRANLRERYMIRPSKSNAGFTLIELGVVLALMAFLLAYQINQTTRSLDFAKLEAVKKNLHTLALAGRTHWRSHVAIECEDNDCICDKGACPGYSFQYCQPDADQNKCDGPILKVTRSGRLRRKNRKIFHLATSEDRAALADVLSNAFPTHNLLAPNAADSQFKVALGPYHIYAWTCVPEEFFNHKDPNIHTDFYKRFSGRKPRCPNDAFLVKSLPTLESHEIQNLAQRRFFGGETS